MDKTSEQPRVTGLINFGTEWLSGIDTYTIEVTCPFCNKQHYHGLGQEPAKYNGSSRMADCLQGEYTLIVEGFTVGSK